MNGLEPRPRVMLKMAAKIRAIRTPRTVRIIETTIASPITVIKGAIAAVVKAIKTDGAYISRTTIDGAAIAVTPTRSIDIATCDRCHDQ
jgi:hypothetical protein